MNKKWLFVVMALLVSACVSEQERRESLYRYEQTMRNQCEHRLGFSAGTSNYMSCRMFYDEYLTEMGYTSDGMSYNKADRIQSKIDELNNQCSMYWGVEGISGQYLWSCIQTLAGKAMEKAKHERELKEKEEVLTRSIAAGQKEANNDARLQERIEEERMRVAKLKGKNPKKINCSTTTQSNGYIKVKCK